MLFCMLFGTYFYIFVVDVLVWFLCFCYCFLSVFSCLVCYQSEIHGYFIQYRNVSKLTDLIWLFLFTIVSDTYGWHVTLWGQGAMKSQAVIIIGWHSVLPIKKTISSQVSGPTGSTISSVLQLR